MMSVKVEVNGNLVAVIHAVNRTEVLSAELHTYEYSASVFAIHLDEAPLAVHGFVNHVREQGIVMLTEILCRQIDQDCQEVIGNVAT